MRRTQYTAQQFIDAIPRSGGIISTIAQRVGCSWATVDRFIKEYPTVREAYDAENETVLDVAESVIFSNVRAAAKQQKATNYSAIVDSSDAKWLLSKKGKKRGYGDKTEDTPELPTSGEVVIYIPSNGRA